MKAKLSNGEEIELSNIQTRLLCELMGQAATGNDADLTGASEEDLRVVRDVYAVKIEKINKLREERRLANQS